MVAKQTLNFLDLNKTNRVWGGKNNKSNSNKTYLTILNLDVSVLQEILKIIVISKLVFYREF